MRRNLSLHSQIPREARGATATPRCWIQTENLFQGFIRPENWAPSTAGIIRAAATFWSALSLVASRASVRLRKSPGHNRIEIMLLRRKRSRTKLFVGGFVGITSGKAPNHQPRKKGAPVNIIRTGLGSAFAASVLLLVSNHALADEASSRKSCESLAALSTPTFRVDTSEWVAASRLPAGPVGGHDGGSRPLLVSRRSRPASIWDGGHELRHRH